MGEYLGSYNCLWLVFMNDFCPGGRGGLKKAKAAKARAGRKIEEKSK